jgi:hypothetical protein
MELSRAIHFAAIHGRFFTPKLLHEILSSTVNQEEMSQNPACPPEALEKITDYAISTTHPWPTRPRVEARNLKLVVLIARRTDGHGARARESLQKLLRLELKTPDGETMNIASQALYAGAGTDADISAALDLTPKRTLHFAAANHPALGPLSCAKILRQTPNAHVLRLLARHAKEHGNADLRDQVLKIVHARVDGWDLDQQEESIAKLLVDLSPTYSPEEFRSEFRRLVKHAPAHAVRLLKAGGAARRSLLTPNDIAPILLSTDDAVRFEAVRMLHRVPEPKPATKRGR